MEREPEQPLLLAREDEVIGCRGTGPSDVAAVDEDWMRAALLDHVQASRLALRSGHEDRLGRSRSRPRAA